MGEKMGEMTLAADDVPSSYPTSFALPFLATTIRSHRSKYGRNRNRRWPFKAARNRTYERQSAKYEPRSYAPLRSDPLAPNTGSKWPFADFPKPPRVCIRETSTYEPPASDPRLFASVRTGPTRGLGNVLSRSLRSGWGTVASACDTIWTRFRRQTLMERLGHKVTVWTLVLGLAAFGGIATALAAWEAGSNTRVPEVDSNFWSTLSQNSIGAGSLYCILIPILRNEQTDTQNTKLFRFWLLVSGVGALGSSIVYIAHVRTSIVLGYLSSLAQLLATLQLIVDVGKVVVNLEEATWRADDLGDRVDVLGAQVDSLEIENFVLRSRLGDEGT